MTLTKWDIIDANVSDRSMENDLQGIKDCMDEYAKQQSISFAEWIGNKGIVQYNGFDKWINMEEPSFTVYATGQLYEQFLNETNNKK